MKKWLQIFLIIALGCAWGFYGATSALAGGTPGWWDNPESNPQWRQVIATGSASNTGPQVQYVIVVLDVANEFNPDAHKFVWAQVEWTLVQGTGRFRLGSTDHLIKWMNNPIQCPQSPSDPYPDPPDGSGFMKQEGAFSPEFGFASGNELSFGPIVPQPNCERVEFRFEVGPNSQIDYRIEVQTICFFPDFGDAPDPTFPTKLINDGARHYIKEGFFLGNAVDAEPDAFSDPNAQGDDQNGADDEDGVTFVNPLMRCGLATVSVIASAAGKLDAWIDFNNDGDWADPGEQIFASEDLQAGANALTFTVPCDATPTTKTFAMFRFSSAGGLSYTGPALDGEVEVYALPIGEPMFDFGDAPDPTYPTLLANDGARHVIVPGFYMGMGVDADNDGQPDPLALGDDAFDGNDDEDGLSFPQIPLIQGATNQVNVTTSAAGYINAWMDFNNDGDWTDAGEHIIVDYPATSGVNTISFTIPIIDADGPKLTTARFTRFRFSSVPGLSFYGLAPDGEVEDCHCDILIPVELSSFTAKAQNGHVELSWITQTESENLGFHVYRASSRSGPFTRITNDLIPGAGNSSSQRRYYFQDLQAEAAKKYFYRLGDVSRNGTERKHPIIEILVEIPQEHGLQQNYPNPFNPETRISFHLKENGRVTLRVYDLLGHVVRELVSEEKKAGAHFVNWDGKDNNGVTVAAGTYFYQIQVNDFKQTRKMTLVK